MSWIVFSLLLVSLPIYAYLVLRPRGGKRGIFALTPAVAAAAALPFAMPAPPEARALASVVAVVLAAKCFELARGSYRDPAMLATFPRFVFWMFIPPDSRAPKTTGDAIRARELGRRRLLRGTFKAVLAIGLIGLNSAIPGLHEAFWSTTLWAMWAIYLVASGMTDLGSGVAMQSGIFVAENFDAPLIARSVREFWGKRWNVFITTFAFRNIFLPLGGRRAPLSATLAVFIASGLMHEYVVVASVRSGCVRNTALPHGVVPAT